MSERFEIDRRRGKMIPHGAHIPSSSRRGCSWEGTYVPVLSLVDQPDDETTNRGSEGERSQEAHRYCTLNKFQIKIQSSVRWSRELREVATYRLFGVFRPQAEEPRCELHGRGAAVSLSAIILNEEKNDER